MRTLKGPVADSLKRMILPLTAGLLGIAYLPHRFGWTDVVLIAIAVLIGAIAVFSISYLWEQLGRNKSKSN
jgi:hypothetical protein